MGQCQYCRRDSSYDPDLTPDKPRGARVNGHKREVLHGSDLALDTGQSYCDDGSCRDGTRGSHSSDSSGKYSLRESLTSSGECERRRLTMDQREHLTLELNQDDRNGEGTSGGEDDVRPLQIIFRGRKVSRSSIGSDHDSISSVSSVTAVLQERIGRSTSLKIRRSRAESESGQESAGLVVKQARRAVSLRLPRSHRRRHEADTKLPTIYVEESPRSRSQQGREKRRKSSLRRALSLLSINSLRHVESPAKQKPQKPVQKILRQPRRRHNTVRGLSGMAIDAVNQPMHLHRSNTLYYPTAATMRQTYSSRRTYSDNMS